MGRGLRIEEGKQRGGRWITVAAEEQIYSLSVERVRVGHDLREERWEGRRGVPIDFS